MSSAVPGVSAAGGYHHGDLPAALVRAARELLAEDRNAELSLRAVARRAGVSSAAPYRHFADRMALLSAVAAVGYGELLATLRRLQPEPVGAQDIGELAVAYVDFALANPGLFRVMFAEGCDPTSAERVAAIAAVDDFLHRAVARLLGFDDTETVAAQDDRVSTLATGLWATAHGLAFLYLDGKLGTPSKAERDRRVRSVLSALIAAEWR